MNDETVKEMLDRYANLESAVDTLLLAKRDAIESVLTDEQRKQITEIEAEFEGKVEIAQENLIKLKADLQSAVLQLGHSVKGSFKQIQFVKASPKWNSDGLIKLANEYPAIKAFMTEGMPTTRLVNNK